MSSISTSQSTLGQLFLKPGVWLEAVALTMLIRESWTNRREQSLSWWRLSE